jgi:hypothetical protein
VQIYFHRTDHQLDQLWDLEELHEIADIIIENSYLLWDIADLILTSTSLEKYRERRIHILANNMDDSILRRTLSLFKKTLDKLSNNGKSQDKNLEELRGAFLEILVYRIVSPRFSKKNHNCRVKVNSETIAYKDKLTIDIACYDNTDKKGKFFECKVNPYCLGKRNLLTLKNYMQNSRIKWTG